MDCSAGEGWAYEVTCCVSSRLQSIYVPAVWENEVGQHNKDLGVVKDTARKLQGQNKGARTGTGTGTGTLIKREV